jgi:hypothetical protein
MNEACSACTLGKIVGNFLHTALFLVKELEVFDDAFRAC